MASPCVEIVEVDDESDCQITSYIEIMIQCFDLLEASAVISHVFAGRLVT